MKRTNPSLTIPVDFAGRQEELSPLVERQARLYTMGDSSSLPGETVLELLHSVCFSIQAGLEAEGGGSQSLAHLFARGQRELWRQAGAARALLNRVSAEAPGYGSLSHRDTLAEAGVFFQRYDLRFFAHQVPCLLDYPVFLPGPEELEGIWFMGDFLGRLLLEGRFCRCFEEEAVHRVLKAHHPQYRVLVLNLFEPVFSVALGLSLLGRDPAPLRLSSADLDRLHQMFRPWREEEAALLLRQAASRLCIRLGLLDTAARRYLLAAGEELLPRLRHTSREGWGNLFPGE